MMGHRQRARPWGIKQRWYFIRGDNGNDIDRGEEWLLMLVLETLEKETGGLRTAHCQLDQLCKPEGPFAAQQIHISHGHWVDWWKSGLDSDYEVPRATKETKSQA